MTENRKIMIECKNIIKRFYIGQPNELEILHGIDLDVREGEFISIVGESGSGKSTLMNIIGALDRPTEGSYILEGIDICRAKDRQLSEIRNRRIGFVFQTYNLIARTTALSNVELPMLYAGVPKTKRVARAKELLDMVGMSDRMSHRPDELSGGQKQRVAIARAMANNPFQEMGANNITVGIKQSGEEAVVKQNGMKFGTSNRYVTAEEEDLITDEMISGLKAQFSSEIDAISISESVASGTARLGSDSANISITGINEDYFESSDVTLLAGRKIKEEDLEGKKKVIMVSNKVVENVFDGDNQKALWQKLSVDIDGVYYDYYIIGVYKYEENSNFSSSSEEDITTTAYIPLTTGKEQIHSDEGYSQFTVVTAAEIASVSDFAEQIKLFFAPYYAANEDYEISTSTMESMTESMNDMIQTVSIAIAFIAGISLLVGGIGVMNIMLVSITERTKEIGTRKALGAKNSSIRLQFIIESVILCLVGGCFGILLGFVLGAIAASLLGYSAAAPVATIFIAVGFSMVIGVFFGYYPANKAAKLDPIEALRYE